MADDAGQQGRPPSVDALARSLTDCGLPQPLLVDAARRAIAAGDPDRARAEAVTIARTLLQPTINATGVLLHTNLGRAPLPRLQGATYSNLELDLVTGERGSRSAHAATLMARACGAEAGLVVNNGAAAVLLVLAALARDRGVAVSRGELVEIGGGFRVPEVMAESGARLVEVGTTNRTRVDDYDRALADPGHDIAVVMKIHKSNYRITGFTDEASVDELSRLIDSSRALVVDLGSGLLDSACPWLADGPPPWLRDEPAVRQTLGAGADLVVFSGDKLLGGPQAGIIVGRSDLVATCNLHPLARALRPGALILGAMQDVALAYLSRTADRLPFWRMATMPVAEVEARATALRCGTVVQTEAVTGGGTLPGVDVPSAGIAIEGDRTAQLRAFHPPVIARVQDGRTILDLRTVDPADDPTLVAAVRTCHDG